MNKFARWALVALMWLPAMFFAFTALAVGASPSPVPMASGSFGLSSFLPAIDPALKMLLFNPVTGSFIVRYLAQFVKQAPALQGKSTLIIRAVVLLLAAVVSFMNAWVSGNLATWDATDTIHMGYDAIVEFGLATGWWHLQRRKEAAPAT